MSFPQLTGRSGQATLATSANVMLMSVLALGALVAGLAWLVWIRPVVDPPQSAPVSVAAVSPPAPARDRPDELRLAHAEQQLVSAQEQLTSARRQLAALSPLLTRSYLQLEKRRVDAAWTTCDAAQRAVEQAIDDIRSINKE